MSFWPYVLGAGGISWLAFYRGGLHPALALVPIVPFLPHAARDSGLLVESENGRDTLNDFEHRWKRPVQVIVCFFGLVNAGVGLSHVGTGTYVVLAAILVGKPAGILISIALGVAFGLKRPANVGWANMIVLSTIAGIGFTVALFFATASFTPGELLDQTKMGALLSLSSGAVAALAAGVLRVGRFAHDNSESSLLSR